MQVFKTRWFARQERITNTSLLEAIERAERGLIDADLGGGLIEQRVGRRGQGRSGGYRVIAGYRARGRAVFLLGFAKSDGANISQDEFKFLREHAENWLACGPARIREEIESGNLLEVEDGEEN